MLERRKKPRVSKPFPTTVSGIDETGESFEFDCVLDNISSTGLYLRIPRQMPTGGEVRLVVHLLSGSTSGVSASIYGRILRDEPQRDHKHGIAVAIKGHKVL